MTLNDLIEELENLRDIIGRGNGEVFVASQPSWPLTNRIENVISNREVTDGDDPEQDTHGVGAADVWIAIDQVGNYSDVNPYAPSGAWGDKQF
jgi:hypothetical protein